MKRVFTNVFYIFTFFTNFSTFCKNIEFGWKRDENMWRKMWRKIWRKCEIKAEKTPLDFQRKTTKFHSENSPSVGRLTQVLWPAGRPHPFYQCYFAHFIFLIIFNFFQKIKFYIFAFFTNFLTFCKNIEFNRLLATLASLMLKTCKKKRGTNPTHTPYSLNHMYEWALLD